MGLVGQVILHEQEVNHPNAEVLDGNIDPKRLFHKGFYTRITLVAVAELLLSAPK
jgi:hypothetical protein